MSTFSLCSGLHKRSEATILLAFVVAVAAAVKTSAQMIDDYPPVPCDSTMLKCLECRSMGSIMVCSNCEEGYSTAITPVTAYEFGKCRPYDPDKCTLTNCVRCAADDGTKCVQCPVGYPNMNTYLCDEIPRDPTTSPPTESSPSPSGPSSTPTPTTLTPTTPTPTPTTPAPEKNCFVPSCITCVPGKTTTCSVCEPTMVLMVSGQCKAYGSCSVDDCLQCYPLDDNRCTTCNPSFALSTPYDCTLRHSRNAVAAPLMSALVTLVTVAAANIV